MSAGKLESYRLFSEHNRKSLKINRLSDLTNDIFAIPWIKTLQQPITLGEDKDR